MPTAWKAFAEIGGIIDASSVTTYFCHTMNLHMRRRAGEVLASEWWLRKCHTHIKFFPSLLSSQIPLSAPRQSLNTNCLFFPSELHECLLQTLASTCQTERTQVPSGASDEHISMMLGKWNQDFQLLSHISKRKISSDYLYNKPVSLNGASYCSGTEVSHHEQDHQLEEGVEQLYAVAGLLYSYCGPWHTLAFSWRQCIVWGRESQCHTLYDW